MPENTIVAYLVTEFYPYDCNGNPPYNWEIEPVFFGAEPYNCLYFRDGRVIGTILGNTPTEPVEEDDNIAFMLEPDGDADGNQSRIWKAFSTKEKAEKWIASRKLIDPKEWISAKIKAYKCVV